jgi:thiopeptide-type bacteriocin biosynthesis protein
MRTVGEVTAPDFRHGGFCVLRTPLLAMDELSRWSAELSAPRTSRDDAEGLERAVLEDRARLAARLREQLGRASVREALFVASPSLDEAISAWLVDERSPRAGNVLSILVRYFCRLTSRATPFGLFSTCAVASIVPGRALRLALGPEVVRHTRLDMAYVSALAEALEREPVIRKQLRFAPNTSLYRQGGQLRYIEARSDPITQERVNTLVGIVANDAIETVLAGASSGTTIESAAAALARARPGLSPAEAEAFVESLIQNGVLVSELLPAVTGASPLDDLITSLERLTTPGVSLEVLRAVRAALEELDVAGIGLDPERYGRVADVLMQLQVPVNPARLFHVDLYRPSTSAGVGEGLLAELSASAALLARIDGGEANEPLERFRERFVERYERQAVPLVEALDAEVGIGFPIDEQPGNPAPLIDGLDFGGSGQPAEKTFTRRDTHRLRRVLEILGRQGAEWQLDDDDLAALSRESRPLPDAFVLVGTLVAASPAALERGEGSLLVRGVAGPSGARLFGRFCHGDPTLRERVGEHLAAEEAARPDCIFAEIAHLPEGRAGNVLCRPALRAYEIPYLARAGVDAEHTLAITDLWVSVEGERIVLRSQSRGVEVVPRLTSAHAVGPQSLPIYRFLYALQNQGVESNLGWSWGNLSTAPRLPRVTRGRMVLAPAQWTLRASELTALIGSADAERFLAAQDLREKTGLPRWVTAGDGDQQLAIDLDNILSLDVLAQLARERPELTLKELYPSPEELCVAGDGGRYVHELAVPFVRVAKPASPVAKSRSARRLSLVRDASAAVTRRFAPGSEWLTLKCYAGPCSSDEILRSIVSPLLAELGHDAEVTRWFFVRYADPVWHLRLRFQGPRSRLLSELLPKLHDRFAPALLDGRVARLQLDTYARELERYGGPEAMPLVEELFYRDSEAVLAIVDMLEGDDGEPARWLLALRGLHDLMLDFGLDVEEQLALVSRLRKAYAAEHRLDARLEKQLSARFRSERQNIERVLSASADSEHPLALGIDVLAKRGRETAPIVARLRKLEAGGKLDVPNVEILSSLLHMHVNRLLPSQQRTQELVLYDLLTRHYRSEIARAFPRARRSG